MALPAAKVTCYRGARGAVSGATFTAAGGAGFTVPAAELPGTTPKPGDTFRAADGTWHTVRAAALADGLWTLGVSPEGGA